MLYLGWCEIACSEMQCFMYRSVSAMSGAILVNLFCTMYMYDLKFRYITHGIVTI